MMKVAWVFHLEMRIRSVDQRQTNFIEVLYAILTNFVLHFGTNSLEPAPTDRETSSSPTPSCVDATTPSAHPSPVA